MLQQQRKSPRATKSPANGSTNAGQKRSRGSEVESRVSSSTATTSGRERIVEQVRAANSTGPGEQTSRSCRQKHVVMYNEDDIASPPSLKRLRKSGLFHDDCRKTTKLNEGITGHNGPISGANATDKYKDGGQGCRSAKSQERHARHVGSSSVKTPHKGSMTAREGQDTTCMNAVTSAEKTNEETSEHGTATAGFTDADYAICDIECVYAEAEFHKFSENRLLQKFSVGQIWALYSDLDRFPNYYGLIHKVDPESGEIQVRWLYSCPQGEEEKRLLQEGRSIALGAFKVSDISDMVTYSYTDVFSHPVDTRTTGKNCEYEIIPNAGEIWAVYKNWRKGWTAQDYENCEYELVDIIGDSDSSTKVQILRKVDGYNVVFMPYKRAGSVKTIRKDEYPKFAHRIPCFRFAHENGGKLRGCVELDPFSLPKEFLIRSFSVQSTHIGLMSAGEMQGATCTNAATVAEITSEYPSEHETATVGFTDADYAIFNTECVYVEAEFHKFSENRFLQKFSVGQIWALYSDLDKFPNYYGLIHNVNPESGEIQVRWLYSCPQGEEEKRLLQEGRSIALGAFKVSNVTDMVTYSYTDVFSHPVDTRTTGKNCEYEIIPNVGEIWAVYKNWRKGWTAQDYENCEYELVDIVGYSDSSTKVQILRKVDGYNVVFMPYKRAGSVKTIRKDEYPKFAHRIPCFRFTHENGGKLRGCVELDPFSLPKEFLIRSFSVQSTHIGSMSAGEMKVATCTNAATVAEITSEYPSEHETATVGFTDADYAIFNTECVDVEAEFHKFSENRLLQKFSVGQIWALYNDLDKFPNYYGLIHTVDPENGKIQVRWLYACPKGEVEKRLLQEGLPIVCGAFKLSHINDMVACSYTDVFSHPVEARKTVKHYEYEIIPNVGEIWAIYRNWRTGWTAQDYGKCEYELVEIFRHTRSSTQVKLLRKVDGYNVVFKPYKGRVSVKTIRKDEYPKFAHQIPCFRLIDENGGKLRGCVELDPFSLPKEFLISSSSIQSPHNGSISAREMQGTTCMNAMTVAEITNERTCVHETASAGFTDADCSICNTECVYVEAEFHKFSENRLLQKFSVGQIWALYSDLENFPNYYGLIHTVDLENGKIQVRWLYACPQGKVEKRLLQEGLPLACGAFKVSSINDMVTYSYTDVFSHPVEAKKTVKNHEYEIVPNVGEIWAVYRNWRTGWTAQDYGKCEYELVEIFRHTDSSIQVKLLRKVDGYHVLFMPYKGQGSVKTIRKDEYPKFSHRIPCFRLTDENGGKLRGCLELDPFSLPKEFLIGSFNVQSPHNGSMSAMEVHGTTCMNEVTAAEITNEHPSVHGTATVGFTDADYAIGDTECVSVEPEFHKFSESRLFQKFSVGQIWALYSDLDKFPNYYGLIHKVDPESGEIQVRWLYACPEGEEEKRLLQEGRSIALGAFKVSDINDIMTLSNTDAFSHPVEARRIAGSKCQYEIIPNHGEVWAVYQNWSTGWTAQDYKNCQYELVEIIANTDSSTQVKLMRKLDGYNVVFMSYKGERFVKTIRKDEYLKFSHQIPCFRLTREDRGKLRGCLELDPFSLPKEFLGTNQFKMRWP